MIEHQPERAANGRKKILKMGTVTRKNMADTERRFKKRRIRDAQEAQDYGLVSQRFINFVIPDYIETGGKRYGYE